MGTVTKLKRPKTSTSRRKQQVARQQKLKRVKHKMGNAFSTCWPPSKPVARGATSKTSEQAGQGKLHGPHQPQQPVPAGQIEPQRILFYDRDQPYYEFTNFSEHPVKIGKHTFKTSEAAYQAQKFASNLHTRFYALRGREAFDLAVELKPLQRHDWFSVNIQVMNAIVALKIAQHPEIKSALLNTGEAELVEDSPIDSFFGCGKDGKGRNELGKIWMAQRARLRAEGQRDTVKDVSQLLSMAA